MGLDSDICVLVKKTHKSNYTGHQSIEHIEKITYIMKNIVFHFIAENLAAPQKLSNKTLSDVGGSSWKIIFRL